MSMVLSRNCCTAVTAVRTFLAQRKRHYCLPEKNVQPSLLWWSRSIRRDVTYAVLNNTNNPNAARELQQ